MTPAQALAWAQAVPALVSAGVYTFTAIRGLIQAAHSGATPAQIDAVLDAVFADAMKHKALALAEVAKAS